MSNKTRVAAIVLMTLSLYSVSAQSQGVNLAIAPGEGIEFVQLDFPGTVPPVLDSSVGTLRANLILLRGMSGLDSGYINVIVDNNWVVQNMVVLPEALFPYSHLSVNFDLNVVAGTDVTSIDAEVIYSDEIQLNAPFTPAQTFAVGTFTNNTGGIGIDSDRSEGGDPTPPVISYDFGGPKNDQGVAQLDHPNIEAALNQCYPMAVANSLQFLEITAGLDIPHEHKPGLKGDDTLVGQIGEFMERQTTGRLDEASKGVEDTKGLEGKLKYLAENDLGDRVVTRHWGRFIKQENVSVDLGGGKTASSTFVATNFTHAEIMKALANGEDCEAAFSFTESGGGHAIDIVGAGMTNGVPWITEASDIDQESDSKGAGPAGFRFWQLKEFEEDEEDEDDDDKDGFFVMGGSERLLDMLVCEKVVEPPPELPPFIPPPPSGPPIDIFGAPVTVLDVFDIGGHLCCLGPLDMPPSFFDLLFGPSGMQMADSANFTPLIGPPPLPNGNIFLTNTGTIAGFPDVLTEFQGTMTSDGLWGQLVVGATGLPGNLPTIFDLWIQPPGPEGSLWPWITPPETMTPMPVPLIRINGFLDQLFIAADSPVSISVSVDAKGQSPMSEFWLAVLLGNNWWSYDLIQETWLPGLNPVAQAPLFDAPFVPIFSNLNGLPPGLYEFYFGFDTNPDGIPNLDTLKYDQIQLGVQPCTETEIFTDGFESGCTSAWTSIVP